MSNLTAKNDYESAAALRKATFELLEEHRSRRSEPSNPDVVTALQDAANRLGAAERALLEALASVESTHPSPPLAELPADARAVPTSCQVAIALALAETVVPPASSRADEAERWLRIMRESGQVGDVLKALGMASGELATPSGPRRNPDPSRQDPVVAVAKDAARFARDRSAPAIGTADLLFAVILQYGSLFDRALYGATSKGRSDLLAALKQAEAAGLRR